MNQEELKTLVAQMLRELAPQPEPQVKGSEYRPTVPEPQPVGQAETRDQLLPDISEIDLREQYLGCTLSHACVLRRCQELLGDGRIHQFCIRSGDREEFQFAKAHTELHLFQFEGLEETVAALREQGIPVYVTIDLDCLDPSVFPGTGTPEAGGVSFRQLLEAVRTVCTANVIGADVNELAPALDSSGVSTATACKVLRELILALHQNKV